MERILYVEMEDVLKHETTCKSFGNELIIIELNDSNRRKPEEEEEIAVKLNAFSVLLICKGVMDMRIDGEDFRITENSLVDIMERHVVNDIQFSPGFKGYHVIASKNILSETLFNSRRPPVSAIVSMRTPPIRQMSAEETVMLEEIIVRMLHDMERKEHAWQRDLVMNDLRGFFIEMKNIVFRFNKEKDKQNSPTRDELFFLFIQLLDKHCKEEHNATFYAGELCVTPEHLSNVLKQVSGKPVSKWIGEALMREAQKLLREPDHDLTLQQIADLLCFSDQSAFGKFFKKNSGMSPLQYRML